MNSTNQTFKMVCAIFFGAFIGSALCVWYLDRSVWSLIVGMVAGGAIGYVFCAPAEFAKATLHAWKEADVSKYLVLVLKCPFYVVYGCLVFVDGFVSMIIGILPVLIFVGYVGGSFIYWPSIELEEAVFFSLAVSALCILAVSLFRLNKRYGDRVGDMSEIFSIRCAKWDWPKRVGIQLFESLPFVSVSFLALAIYRFCVRYYEPAKRGMSSALTSIGRFFVLLVKYVHCEGRVQTAAYAALGVVIGWQLESPLAGALIGAALGALSYRLISVRFLRPAVIREQS